MEGMFFPEFCKSMNIKVETFEKWSDLVTKYYVTYRELTYDTGRDPYNTDGYKWFTIKEMKNNKWHVVKIKEIDI